MSYSIRAVLCAVAVVLAGEGCEPMATDLTLRAAGLHTDPNPHSDAPAGALRIADNVVIRRAGVLEPRPGFRAEGLSGGDRFVGIHSAPTGDTSEYYVQGTASLSDDTASVVDITGDVVDSIAQVGDHQGAHVARAGDYLYIPSTFSAGVVAAVSDQAARAAGLPRPQTPVLSALLQNAVQWLDDTDLVAYRLVFEREIGDVVYVSPPSGRLVVENTSGGSRAVLLRLDFADAPAVQAGWLVKAYRSETVTTGITPSDELALAAEYVITSTDVTNGYCEIGDTTEAVDRGESLYTNATQLGALQENGRPPQANVIAAFSEMLFFGDVTERARMQIKFLRPPSLITRSIAQTTTSAAATSINFSGLPATTDYTSYFATFRDLYVMRVDSVLGAHYVEVAGGGVPALTYFPGTGTGAGIGGTINISDTTTGADASIVNTNGVFWLSVVPSTDSPGTVVPYYWYRTANDPGEDLANGEIVQGSGNGEDVSALAASIAKTIGLTAFAVDNTTIIIERDTNSASIALDTNFIVRVPAGQEPNINIDGTRGTPVAQGAAPGYVPYTASSRRFPNRVYYSRKQEPEHVPPVNFIDIGADSEPIIAMRATRRALFVFKTDGIWIISGDTPETLRVEQIDSTARVLHPKAVAVGGDRVFAWTDAGVIMLSEGGVAANLSAPAIEPDLRAIQVALQATTDPASGSTLGCFLRYQDGEERLLLGVPAAVGDAYVASVYQYDMRTQAWTRWDSGDREYSDATSIGGRILFAGQNDAAEGDVWRETLASDEAPHADETQTLSPGALTIVTQTTAEVVVIGAFVVPVGAWVFQDSPGTPFRGVVTSYTGGSPATMTITKSSGTLLVGGEVIFDVIVYEPVEQCIEWIAKTAQVPTVTKHWQRGVLTYESDRRMYDATLSFRSDIIHTAASVTTEHTLHDDALPEDVPFMVTRDHARAAILFPKLCISQGGAQWALSVLHLDYELGSSRAGRRGR